jgi:uncharacterized protein YdiU (UPF0061 family)
MREGDIDLAKELLARMAANGADFTLTCRGLCDEVSGSGSVRVLFADPAAFDEWSVGWRRRLAQEGRDPKIAAAAMRAVNPAFIPRNHRIEEAIAAAVGSGDFEPFETLSIVLSRPFDDQPDFARYAQAPRPEQVVEQTFCGT